MDTQKWSLLLKVLDSGSISAAAAQSNYTISGISRMIANLEQEVGFPLLVRNNRGVGPTDECELLLNDIRTLLHDEEQITQRIANINGLHWYSIFLQLSITHKANRSVCSAEPSHQHQNAMGL